MRKLNLIVKQRVADRVTTKRELTHDVTPNLVTDSAKLSLGRRCNLLKNG